LPLRAFLDWFRETTRVGITTDAEFLLYCGKNIT
jgi:hypothetical protein